MASIRVFSGAVVGLEALPIEVEVDSTPGLHTFNIVGLPDKTVEESKDRIAAAIRNSGFIAPNQKNRRVVVNLAPADVRKEGPAYDLPIALGYLLTSDQLAFDTLGKVFVGELSLDGSLRKVNGVLPVAFMAKRRGFKEIVVPRANADEASIVSDLRVIGANKLDELSSYLSDKLTIEPAPEFDYGNFCVKASSSETGNDVDLKHVKGQETAKQALVIAASGGHNMLMQGPPGSGKTLLAQALAGILPPMSREEALEVTKIYSVCGLIGEEPIIHKRPFRNPHHITSAVAIVGGGSWPKPGEISLAHRGVLFMDEFPEFPRNVLESLRQPMESGEIVVSRAASSLKFPSRFMLIAAMNPCPCGNYGDQIKPCVCSPQNIYRYQKKVSGPVLDRIDIQINVPGETYDNLSSDVSGMTSSEAREIITTARKIQQTRFAGTRFLTNSEMGPKEIKKFCELTSDAEAAVKSVVISKGVSGRGYHKILKVARTIADIKNHKLIEANDVAEAVGYRMKITEGESFISVP